jgi:18S rRNA (guanine1575-N7)-methyltransferase
MSRPELTGDAALFYNHREARKYDSSSRMMGVQRDITERAVELLRLDPDVPSLILDVGCGSGLSGKVLEEHGHVWVGCDVSRDMLLIAKERQQRGRKGGGGGGADVEGDDSGDGSDGEEDNGDDDNVEAMDEEEDEEEMKSKSAARRTKLSSTRCFSGDLLHHDMGGGLPFRPATFDACVSISALQWLCYSNSADQNPRRRLARFFSSLYSVLKRGGRAVLQFYPETAEQSVLITEAATRVGFAGGVVIDYPNSAKAKKHYLVLSFDKGSKQRAATATSAAAASYATAEPHHKQQQQMHVSVASLASAKRSKPTVVRKHKGVKTKEWILHKKESQRRKGKDVRPDSKYTARRRPHKF